jgi:hypothetical protein
MRNLVLLLTLTISLLISNCRFDNKNIKMISIPASGNSWVINKLEKNEKIIAGSGIANWKDPEDIIRTYFYTDKAGPLLIGFRAKTDTVSSTIRVTSGDITRMIKVKNTEYDTLIAGEFNIKHPGYQTIELQGIKKTGTAYASISNILIGGTASEDKVYFIKDDFYFGRRGPSVHLRYDIPEKASDIVWFYNEITIPAGNDVEGSYFMANGFTDGYFGIQVNSPVERRILFSVWSPYKSDNPGEIPDDCKIILLKKGENVVAGEFGNEGSGGQSYRKYMWKADQTYRFLLKGEPSVNNSTDYTAYFYAPEKGKWELIASFRRPKTTSYLKNLYSFLENFIPETGFITRKGFYSNQWICDKNGTWFELSSAKFTADATARKESRLDYAGGVNKGSFVLKNCGFFDERTQINTQLVHSETGNRPSTDPGLLK